MFGATNIVWGDSIGTSASGSGMSVSGKGTGTLDTTGASMMSTAAPDGTATSSSPSVVFGVLTSVQ